MAFYQRRLPHCDVVGQPVFLTFRLHGSLPGHRIFPPDRITSDGRAFAAMDRLLDTATTGPFSLRQPEIAALIVGALHKGEAELGRYHVHAYVVMPNHIHALITPHVAARRWLGPFKGFHRA
jgi:putative transposase